MDWTIQLGTL